MLKIAATVLGASLALLPESAVAQSRAEILKAMAGDWYVFDPVRGTGDAPCRLLLSIDSATSEVDTPVDTGGCAEPLASVARWDVTDGQLVLTAAAGATIARLGGSQARVSGEIEASGDGLILERGSGDESTTAFAAALRKHRCIYLGYTDDCASKTQLQIPVLAEQGGLSGEIELLVRLNVRTQPRADAGVIGTVPQEACITVNQCTLASDGVWCRASFGERQGWLRKTGLRQNEWPVVTYLEGCADTE